MRYPASFVAPMRSELTVLGVEELRTPAECGRCGAVAFAEAGKVTWVEEPKRAAD